MIPIYVISLKLVSHIYLTYIYTFCKRESDKERERKERKKGGKEGGEEEEKKEGRKKKRKGERERIKGGKEA